MAKIIWTLTAAEDFSEIVEYIARDKPDAAANFARTLLASIDQLEQFPHKGRPVPEFPKSQYREVILAPCRVIYRPLPDAVEIIRVIRGERLLRTELLPHPN